MDILGERCSGELGVTAHGYRTSVWDDDNVVILDCRYGCTTLWI